MKASSPYPRDMAGFGAMPPHADWPGDARVAVQFVINYEEGSELSPLHGDAVSETRLTEDPVRALHNLRSLSVESQYEYGSRAGFWRLYRAFTERDLPVTVFGVAQALARNPAAVAAMNSAGWEIASHGLRWLDYTEFSEDQERLHITEAFRLHHEVTGAPLRGWYTGKASPHTRDIAVSCGDLLYDSDSFADDLPYWVPVGGRPHLVIPYALDTNDGRFVNGYGFQTSAFSTYLVESFEQLYREGAHRPRMMSIGLHCRITGHPGRTFDLERFLDHVMTRDRVWVTRRIDIAQHWRVAHPPESF